MSLIPDVNIYGTYNSAPAALPPASPPPNPPGAFRRALGGIVQTVGNVFAPGVGTALGGLIGRSSGLGGLGSIGANGSDPMQYLMLQQQMSQEAEAFQSVSAVLKTKHDSAMAAIRNISG